MDALVKFMENKTKRLVFTLIAGTAYFVIVLMLANMYSSGGGLIVFFFLPAIICGAALMLFKAIDGMLESDNRKGIGVLFGAHVLLVALAIFFAVAMAVA